MNLHTTGLIIRREYLNRVKKKSFLLITFLSPILFAALCILPTVIMLNAKEDSKSIGVIDCSGIVAPTLSNTETILYSDLGLASPDSVKANMAAMGLDAVLCISELDSTGRSVSADIFSVKPLGVDMTGTIDRGINDAVEAHRVASYNIAGLSDILEDVKGDIHLHSYTIDEEGGEKVSEASVYMLVSMLLGIIIYMFIALFGGMVMSSVIEEKASRVVEVLVSSVKATELMFGKIIGIALVALTQFLLWIVLTLAIVGVVGAVAGQSLLGGADMAQITEMTTGMGGVGLHPDAGIDEMSDMGVIVSTLSNLPVAKILISFVIFFVFGYMLYASIFAAIGSSVENEGDTQQLQIPVTIPLLIGFFIALYAYKAPDSALVFWGSMIPFTSPIVMLARLPFDVPVWELVVSLVVLVITFIVFAWASAKIYKVGILMFGKKSTWKDLWNWFKQK